MPIDPDAVGAVGEETEIGWTSKDSLLYALGVGAGASDPTGFELEFTTENTRGVPQRALPTQAVVLGAGNMPDYGDFNLAALLHGDQRIEAGRQRRRQTLGQALTGEPVRLAALGMLGRLGGLTFVGAFAGLGLGAAQWLALRAAAPVARRWVVWCVAGFGAGLPAGSLAAELVGGLQSPVGFAAFLGVAGLTLGVFTARGGAAIAAGLTPRRAD